MILVIALLLAALAQFGLQSVHLPTVLTAAQPLLLVIVAAARRYPPAGVAWLGLGVGLMSDVLADRIIGPGAIACALAGAAVAVIVRRFELAGPLFWIVGSLLAAATSEVGLALILASLGVRPDHGWLGGVAAFAMTGAVALGVAAGEWLIREWRSPQRRRRRLLRRL